MKSFKSYYLLAICAFVAIISCFSACKKDSNYKPDITGTWNMDVKLTGNIQRQSYLFNADSTLLITRAILDTTGKLLGYNYKATRKYSFDGTNMKFYQLITYVDLDVTPLAYTTLQALVAQQAATTQSFVVKFNSTYTSFNVIYPPCPALANCIILSPLYVRQ